MINCIKGSITVGGSGIVTQINEMQFGQSFDQRLEDSKSTVTRIEDSNFRHWHEYKIKKPPLGGFFKIENQNYFLLVICLITAPVISSLPFADHKTIPAFSITVVYPLAAATTPIAFLISSTIGFNNLAL